MNANIAAAIVEHPNWRYLSKGKLFQALRSHGVAVSTGQFDKWWAENKHVVHELFAKPKKRIRQARITAPPYSYQIDVVRMDRYRSQNRGIDRFLLLVEIGSRKAFAYVLKSESVQEVLKAYRKFLKDAGHKPFYIQGDDYFAAREFQEYNDKKCIAVVTVVADDEHVTEGDPLGILDRLVQTLRGVMEKRIHAEDDTHWPAWLDELIADYNATPHSTLDGMTPDHVYDDLPTLHARWVKDSTYNAAVGKEVQAVFKVGDYVRKRLKKAIFEKGSTQTMSLQVYTVAAVRGTRVSLNTYPEGAVVQRAAKPNELLKVDRPMYAEGAPAAATAVRESRGRRRLRAEGIAGSSEPPPPPDDASLASHVRVGMLIVVDVEGIPDDPYRLTIERDGKTGFVYTGVVSKVTKKTIHIKLFERSLGSTSLAAKRLRLSSQSFAFDGSAHPDALLHAGNPPRLRPDGTASLPSSVVAAVRREYVFAPPS